MKKLFSKLALVFTIVSIASISTSCRNDDDDSSKNEARECTHYIPTDHFKLDENAPFTKEQLAKEFRDDLYAGCDGKVLYDDNLENVIQATYNRLVLRGWIKYVHGTALIMCHVKSINEEVPMYEYNIDTGKIGYIFAD